ncbi:hypothetical protein WIS05_14035 [Clostridioides difficile]|uniref:Bacitracin export ATP-binding protein BceA n=1 Tax=Clostridioides difficile TaxID=1496 RepID=A0A069AFA4_CLODI|nr:hypothetical protein [Clostridioides difficile]EHJ36164.1 hypothetical protein HMPREF9945_03083 [Clostridioides difficile 70-100-2010]EQE29337.1 putative sulfate-transporting ATPase [Clostridioides difficile CD34]EQE41878.1 putative sulfate-transporting ATPase [Clostridioides difficile CD41]EQE90189.1 putative sulfate-transporting ATPase [Clostridioides difficile CD104]EQF66158.1 putative sulfate-transporting ATPase [Clostridioides difficile CD206]
MLTNDAFIASYTHRNLFIKYRKIFIELARRTDSIKESFNRIIEEIAIIRGDDNNVF